MVKERFHKKLAFWKRQYLSKGGKGNSDKKYSIEDLNIQFFLWTQFFRKNAFGWTEFLPKPLFLRGRLLGGRC